LSREARFRSSRKAACQAEADDRPDIAESGRFSLMAGKNALRVSGVVSG
jgi:hypothetical protein